MKKVIQLLTIAVCFSLTQTANAQNKSEDEITISSDLVIFDNDPKFVCKELTYNNKTQVMTLKDNVSLKTSKFEFSGANKVVYDEKLKKLTLYDCSKFHISGKVVIKANASKDNVVEYTLGDDIAYIL